jgi:hypothetical protein
MPRVWISCVACVDFLCMCAQACVCKCACFEVCVLASVHVQEFSMTLWNTPIYSYVYMYVCMYVFMYDVI